MNENKLKPKSKFVESVMKSIEWIEKVDRMTYKDLADFLIYHYPKEYTLGSEECAVLDRVISILFNLQDKEDLKHGK